MIYIAESINKAYEIPYELLCYKDLVGILTAVFYKKGMPIEGPVPSWEVKTGFKGVAGNKGSVSFSFNVFNSSICVVNCHLAAKKHGVK